MKYFLFGFGQVSKALVKRLKERKFEFDVISRKVDNFLNLNFKQIDFFFNEEINLSNSVLISTVPPDDKDKDYILNNLPTKIIKNFKRIIYISSTSVYQSGTVNENTIPKPLTTQGLKRLAVEQQWQKINKNFVVIRSGGIYNKQNNLLTRYLNSDFKLIYKKDHFVNRIHIEDLIGIILKIIDMPKFKGIVNATDSCFICSYELIKKLSQEYSFNRPIKIDYDDENAPEKLKTFYKVSKKVYSSRLINELSYYLKYPKFDEYLYSLLEEKKYE